MTRAILNSVLLAAAVFTGSSPAAAACASTNIAGRWLLTVQEFDFSTSPPVGEFMEAVASYCHLTIASTGTATGSCQGRRVKPTARPVPPQFKFVISAACQVTGSYLQDGRTVSPFVGFMNAGKDVVIGRMIDSDNDIGTFQMIRRP
jgi:hypothetical protein